MVFNGGFEEVEKEFPKGWFVPRDICYLDSQDKHSGKFSLRYERTDKNDYRLVSQRLPCVPGKLYKVTVWVKGENVKGEPTDQGAGFCIEWSDREGNWLGGSYTNCISGTFNWREISTYVRIPKEASSAHITLYMRRGTTGVAWFDDVEVLRVAPPLLTIRLIVPSYRGYLYLPTKGRKIIAEIEIDREDYDLIGIPLEIKSKLTDTNGKTVSESKRRLEEIEQEIMLSLSLPALVPGNYKWSFYILKENKEIAWERTDIRVIKEEKAKVYIDEKNRLIVDGEPFFPLGIYLGPTEEEHLKRIADAGFNTILCYGYGVENNPEAYMERARKFGLKVIYSLKDFYEGTAYFPEMGKSGLELAKEYVEKLREHPTLLAWYINDELPISYIPKITEMYELVKKLDPNHPQFQVLYQIPDLELYYNCTDVMGVDPYPIPSQPITMVSDWTSSAVKAMHNAKPVWVVPQIFDPSVYNSKMTPREPSYEEKKNMFYQALINGAKGLIAYSYFDLLRVSGGKDAPLETFNRRWEEISNIVGEMKQLIPILLEGEDIPNLQGKTSNGKVILKGIAHQNKLYILVANISTETVSLTIHLPTNGLRSIKRIDGTPVSQRENKLRDQLKPLEATTYVVCK